MNTWGFVDRSWLMGIELGWVMHLAVAAPTKEESSIKGVFSGMFTHGVSSILSRFLTESVLL